MEGGLARHVRKLAEELVRQRVEVHVLARGRQGDPREEVRAGVRVHRVRETRTPRDLDEFVTWIEGMNQHMLTAGRELLERFDVDLVHGHDWLVAPAAATLAEEAGRPYLTTIHATEYGRHQGWVGQAPAVLHPRGRDVDGAPRRAGDRLLALHARPRGRRLRRRRGAP